MKVGDHVELRTNHKPSRYGGIPAFTSIRHGEVVAIGDPENRTYAGRVRVRWTHYTGLNVTMKPEAKIIRTWYDPAKLVVVQAPRPIGKPLIDIL